MNSRVSSTRAEHRIFFPTDGFWQFLCRDSKDVCRRKYAQPLVARRWFADFPRAWRSRRRIEKPANVFRLPKARQAALGHIQIYGTRRDYERAFEVLFRFPARQ